MTNTRLKKIWTVGIQFLVLLWCLRVSAFRYGYDESVSESDYQNRFDGWKEEGFWLVRVTGFEDEEGIVRYNTIWHKNVHDAVWTSYQGLTEEEFQTNVEQSMASQGYYPVFIDGFSVSDAETGKLVPRINVIYRMRGEESPSHAVVKVGQESQEYQTYFNEMVSKGYVLEIVSTYQKNGETRIASLFFDDDDGSDWFSSHNMDIVQAGLQFGAATSTGYSIRYASVGPVENGVPRIAAIYTKEGTQGARSPIPLIEQANLDSLPYMTNYLGYMPVAIDAYKNIQGQLRWMVILVDSWTDEIREAEPNGETFPETDCFDETITTFMKQHKIPGVSTAVLKDGKLVYSQGYGVRDVPGIGEDHSPPFKVMPYTPMRIGSTSKVMTFLAIYRLIQQGSIALSDRVFGDGGILHFMSDAPKLCCPIMDQRLETITVEHLLSHQGGWNRDIAGDPLTITPTIQSVLGITGRPVERDDIIYYMLGQPLEHPPGTTCAYSNFGYTLLSRIIEVVTGMGYEQAVRELFLDESGVVRDESYLGSSLMSEMPPYESEYYCPGCPVVDSCLDFSALPKKVPFHCGGEPLEAAIGCGSWVSSAQQLVQLVSTISEPHCNGTLDSNKQSCLLWKSSMDTLLGDSGCVDVTDLASEVFPNVDSARYAHGFFVAGQGNDLAFGHGGLYLGSLSHLVRSDSTYDHLAWAMISNSLFDDYMEPLMKEAVGCVGNTWPKAFQHQTVTTSSATDRPFRLSHVLFYLVVSDWLLSLPLWY